MENEVKLFISIKLGIPIDEIHKESKIEADFGLAGLDTMLFYDTFFTEFDIVNPEDFDLDEYVTPDVPNFRLLIKSFFSKAAREKMRVKTVSVGHLVRVAEARKWFEEGNPAGKG